MSSIGGTYYSFESSNTGLPVHQIWDFLRKQQTDKFQQLIGEFNKLPNGLKFPCDIAKSEIHVDKIRNKGLYAYDDTRVVLHKESPHETDYIDASFVDGYTKVRSFIASQGPSKAMTDDFWRMVWEQKSDKIVMLTNLIELGMEMCHQYWPEQGGVCTFGSVTIKVKHAVENEDFVVRTLEARKTSTMLSRVIRQFHFKAWSDKDIPDNAWCFVNFWGAIDTTTSSTGGPIIVHCSAGIGRTGTFIAFNNLVDQARAEGVLRPLQIVETLRRQRINMVQTWKQYVYLHEVLAEVLLLGTEPLHSRRFGEVYQYMTQMEKCSNTTRIMKQFSISKSLQQLIKMSIYDTPATISLASESIYENTEEISESKANRPKLINKQSSLFITLGASFLPNYNNANAFLICQSPANKNFKEFWSFVEEQHVVTLVMITANTENEHQASFTLGSNGNIAVKVGNHLISCVADRSYKNYSENTFSLKRLGSKGDENITVKQFEFTAWKHDRDTPENPQSLLDFIKAIQSWQPNYTEAKPVIFYSGDGFGKCGIVAVLLNEIQRINYENGQINIVESVKMMKARNNDVIRNHEQYRFCYDVLEAYVCDNDIYRNLAAEV